MAVDSATLVVASFTTNDEGVFIDWIETSLVNADSYVTLDEYKKFAADYGLALKESADSAPATDPQLAVAARRGTILIEGYGSRFRGERFSPDQALCWPRIGARRASGGRKQILSDKIMSDESIPKAVKVATCFAASYALENPDEINELIQQHRIIKREKIGGRVTVERQYSDLASGDTVRRMLTAVEEILDDMLEYRDDTLDRKSAPTAGLWVSQSQSQSVNINFPRRQS